MRCPNTVCIKGKETPEHVYALSHDPKSCKLNTGHCTKDREVPYFYTDMVKDIVHYGVPMDYGTGAQIFGLKAAK
jgi:hypothetical protein